jgi:hypothetical protein
MGGPVVTFDQEKFRYDVAQRTVQAVAARHGLCSEGAPRRFRQYVVCFFAVPAEVFFPVRGCGFL